MADLEKSDESNVEKKQVAEGENQEGNRGLEARDFAKEERQEEVSQEEKDLIEEAVGLLEEGATENAVTKATAEGDGAENIPAGKNVKFLVIGIVVLILASVVFMKIGESLSVSKAVLESKLAADEEYQEILKEADIARGYLASTQVMMENNAELFNEVTAYSQDKETYTEKLESLKTEVAEKEAQLKRLTADITAATGNPVKLPAGSFTVGTDIEPGRYKITGSSNFFLYSASGELKVNIILGGPYGVSSYIYRLRDGDVIECQGSDTFTPIA